MPMHLIDCSTEFHARHGASATCECPCHGTVVKAHPKQPGLDGPPCIWDNAPTRRSGSCWVCIACGNSTSC